MTDENDVTRIALTLPEATHDGAGYGIRGKGFAWYYREKIPGRTGRIEHRDVLAIRVTNETEKQALIAAEPHKFFTDDHYRGFPAILARLPEMDEDELTELLTDAYRIQAPKRLSKTLETNQPAPPPRTISSPLP